MLAVIDEMIWLWSDSEVCLVVMKVQSLNSGMKANECYCDGKWFGRKIHQKVCSNATYEGWRNNITRTAEDLLV